MHRRFLLPGTPAISSLHMHSGASVRIYLPTWISELSLMSARKTSFSQGQPGFPPSGFSHEFSRRSLFPSFPSRAIFERNNTRKFRR